MPLQYQRDKGQYAGDMDEKTDLSSVPGIQDHAWSPDGTHVAVAPNTQTGEVIIYSVNGKPDDCSKWQIKSVLKEHKMIAMGVDWSAQDQIVTTGQDRNAFVFMKDASSKTGWKAKMVVLQSGRAATKSRWSPDGLKFAAGTADKQIPICYYQKSQEWWVSKPAKKKVASSITDVAWHPSNQVIIAGSTDKKCKIYSAYHTMFGDSVVNDQVQELFPKAAAKIGKNAKGGSHQLVWQSERAEHGWVNAVAWSPCGTRFAYAVHDSSIQFGTIGAGCEVTTQKVLFPCLPFLAVAFLDPNTVVAGGFGRSPWVFRSDGSSWDGGTKMDTGKADEDKPKAGGMASRAAMFGGSKKSKKAGGIKTRHKNDITSLRVLSATTFTTGAMDGNILFWDVSKKY